MVTLVLYPSCWMQFKMFIKEKRQSNHEYETDKEISIQQDQ